MNGNGNLNSSSLNDQNYTAKLAAQFNEFYLSMTSIKISQIGNYKIIQEIGEGSFGKVYLAKHVILNISVVLKCGLIDDPNIIREIYYHKQLKMKNIVSLYEVIKTENHIWIVMEYCQGGELYYHIYERKRLSLGECRNLFFQIVLGVKFVHSLNLSHRDLKLENILLADSKKTVVKLTDFGFIREFNPQSRKFLSTVCGTTVYMAPELITQSKYSGFAIDIWSLGIILYTMLYGVLPFDDDDELQVKSKILTMEPVFENFIPAEVNVMISKMLNKDPNGRPSLNEILNSSFLIDNYNRHLEKEKKIKYRTNQDCNDSESILSINQHYNSVNQPFNTRIEKELLKKLHRLHINIEELQESVHNNDINSLTAFYELLLTQEFTKKKRKYIKEKKRKYNEAKHSLSKSKKRVKSALSLSSDPSLSGSQPLERIISTLSIASNKNSSKTNLTKLANNSNPSKRRSLDFHSQSLQYLNGTKSPKTESSRMSMDPKGSLEKIPSRKSLQAISLKSSDAIVPKVNGSSETHNVSTPLQRAVSFVPDERRLSNVSSNKELVRKNNKSGKILNKLQFWKKSRNSNQDTFSKDDYHEDSSSHHSGLTTTEKPNTAPDNGEFEPQVESQLNGFIRENETQELQSGHLMSSQDIEFNDLGLANKPNFPSHKQSSSVLFDAATTRQSNSSNSNTKVENGMTEPQLLIPNGSDTPSTPPSAENKLTRTRPSSMISQISQFSRLSQMSTMLSESELDILDETDTMDDEDEDDDVYESSINTSQDNSKISSSAMTPTSSNAATHRVRKRPSYKRTLSSDVSIQTNSTSGLPVPATEKNKSSSAAVGGYLEDTSLKASNDRMESASEVNNYNDSQRMFYHRAPSPPAGFKFSKAVPKKLAISTFPNHNFGNNKNSANNVNSNHEQKDVDVWLNDGSNSNGTVSKNTLYGPIINEEDEDE